MEDTNASSPSQEESDSTPQIPDTYTNILSYQGIPYDLSGNQKRWMLVGIGLNCIISPNLRTYVKSVMVQQYSSLTKSAPWQIDVQTYHNHLKFYPSPSKGYFLNYETINNNYKLHGRQREKYDYRVQNEIDLSKLFLPMSISSQYTAFDSTCDSVVLLGIMINNTYFPLSLQNDATMMRSEIRHPWAHCNFKNWDITKYIQSFQLMEKLVKNLGLILSEENRILTELNKWETTEVANVTVDKTLYDKLTALENENNALKAEMEKRDNNPIPINIREQHEQYINEWINDEKTFIITRATESLLKQILIDNCVVVTGSSGNGKSSIIHHVALQLQKRYGYEIIPFITGPSDIVHYRDMTKKQVFVADDVCGKEVINLQTVQTWKDYSEKLGKIFQPDDSHIDTASSNKITSAKLLISCRLHVFKDFQLKRVKLFTKQECNLLSPELCLLPEERLMMIKYYLSDEMIDQIRNMIDQFDFFPLLCKFSKNKTSQELINLFSAPFDNIKKDISEIVCLHKGIQYCVIVLCVIFDETFNIKWLRLKLAPEKHRLKIKDIVKQFDIDLDIENSRKRLKDGFSILEGTYLKRRGTEYRILHDRIYDVAAFVCGQHLPECVLKHASTTFVRDRYLFESVQSDLEDNLIVVSKDMEDDYFERLVNDLKLKNVQSTLHNKQLVHRLFRGKLLQYLRKNIQEVKCIFDQMETLCVSEEDETDYGGKLVEMTTPLIEASAEGFLDIVQFLVDINCNGHQLDSFDRSPLLVACYGGHLNIVQLLLKINVDVNQCDKNGKSPLHTAVNGDDLDIVNLLLNNKANVDQYDSDRKSPLFLACEEGYTKIVKILIEKYADVALCNRLKESPLYIACKNGHANIVRLLLETKANLNQGDWKRQSPLHIASSNGHTDIVKLLIKNKANIFRFDKDGQSPLYMACKHSRTEIMNLFLEVNDTLTKFERKNKLLLHIASKGGCVDAVKLLLKSNADVSKSLPNGESSLFVACKWGRIDTAQLLLDHKANVSQCKKGKRSPLFEACHRGHMSIVKLLLKYKADVSKCNKQRQSPLFMACKMGYTDIVKLLIEQGAVVDQSDKNKQSPLLVACQGGYEDIVDLLLQNNADVSKCDKHNQSPLYVACDRGYLGIVKLLLKINNNSSQCNKFGWSPLYAACKGGDKAIVEMLINNKADVLQCGNDESTPLHVACEYGHADIIQLLLQSNANISKANIDGETPLYVACREGNTNIVKLLVEKNAAVSQCDNFGQSPLYVSCKYGHEDIVKFLLEHNANHEQCDEVGESPLYVSCAGGYENIVKLLLEYNADVSKCNNQSQSPLYVSCAGGYENIVKRLLEYNADVSKCNDKNESPLFVTCIEGHTNIVKHLLENKADVSQCADRGWSALHVACQGGYTNIVKLLLENNSNVDLCNDNGETPLDIAREFERFDIVSLLESLQRFY